MRHAMALAARAEGIGEIPVGAIAAQFAGGPQAAAPRSLLRQGVYFATVGLVSTVAYLVLFVALRGLLGPQGANLIALKTTETKVVNNKRRNVLKALSPMRYAFFKKHVFKGVEFNDSQLSSL